MTFSARIHEIRLNGFLPTFWIANTLELFERLAFYGTKAVLAYYLATKVGLQEEAATLTGCFSTVIFSLPIVAGVFVDRYGFRKTLMTCFAMFAVGYFAIGLAGMEYAASITQAIGLRNHVIIVLMLTAIGGSLIKPCIVGTVAKTSKPEAQTLGFSIYYTLVNLGGTIGPVITTQVTGQILEISILSLRPILTLQKISLTLICLITTGLFTQGQGCCHQQRSAVQLWKKH